MQVNIPYMDPMGNTYRWWGLSWTSAHLQDATLFTLCRCVCCSIVNPQTSIPNQMTHTGFQDCIHEKTSVGIAIKSLSIVLILSSTYWTIYIKIILYIVHTCLWIIVFLRFAIPAWFFQCSENPKNTQTCQSAGVCVFSGMMRTRIFSLAMVLLLTEAFGWSECNEGVKCLDEQASLGSYVDL